MNTAEHKWIGTRDARSDHRRRWKPAVGRARCCASRTGTWTGRSIRSLIPGANAKDAENRRIPFDPKGRLAPILKRRADLGPIAFVFGSAGGRVPGQLQDGLGIAPAGRQRPRHEAREARRAGSIARSCRQIDLHWHDLRHEGACRLLADGVDIRIDPVDARPLRHQDDAAVPEHHGRGDEEGIDRSVGTSPSTAAASSARRTG